jgi:hypothetical protein
MSDRVYLEHPDLPGQGLRVREQAVPTYRASGWVPADEPAPEPAAEPAEDKPRRRRAPQPNKEMSTDGADAA